MKLKEVDRTANVAWSPAAQHPIYLAAGTAAQQLDATFSTKATVELYSLNLAESGQDMELAGSLEVDSRLYKLVWGSFGMDSKTYPSGLLIGGAEQGNLSIWDPVKIISGQHEDTLVHKLDKHTGQVIALDINPFQTNLLASGASESEIYIWDLNSPEKPMTPGSKPQTQHAVSCVAWNRQVQHILGSSHGSNCVVWDLRKNEPIIKIRDSMSRIECNMICWHPDVATQLCIASEDDHAPVIQLWDLRCATSPLRLLERHQRGIVSMAWCPHDSDLLLSSGKDNRILCWNPNSEARSGEVLCEVPTSNRWSFDVQWCPRNPGIISGCSFDGHISVYSLMGGTPPSQPPSKVTEAFPLDPFSQPMPHPTATHEPEETMMKKAPKWLRRPVSANFAFGGKLICVENPKPSHGQAVAPVVTISQVVTETDLVERSKLLENTIASGQYLVFCDSKVLASQDKAERELWSFLKASFTPDPRSFYLELLNYNQLTIRDKVSNNITLTKPTITNHDLKEVSAKDKEEEDEEEEEEEELAQINYTGLDAFARQSDKHGASPFDDITAKSDVMSVKQLPISIGSDCDGLMTEALLTANFAAAVDVALHHNRQAEAMILAIAGGTELLAATQTRVLQSIKSGVSQLLLAIVTRNFENIIRTCDLAKWKEALAIVLTYVDGREFTYLCNLLGSRLESEGNGEYLADAQLCYVVAGNIDQLVSSWNLSVVNGNSPHALQDLVEKVMVLQKAVESSLGQQEVTSTDFARALNDYAHMLAAQGCSLIALQYLGKSNEPLIAVLRDRLFQSLGQNPANMKAPPRPFKVIDVQPERQRQPSQPTQPVNQPRSRTSSANYTQPSVTPFQPISSQVQPSPAVGPYYQDSNPYAAGQPFYPHQPTNLGGGYASQPAPIPVAPSAANKGPLSKYGQASKQVAQQPLIPTSGGMMYDPYQQPPQQHQQQQPQATYAPTEYQPSFGQLITNPGSQTPGAPLPAYASMTAHCAWNDPPTVTTSKKSSVDHPGAPSYEGVLYNPLEYEEQMRQQQQAILEQHQQHQQQHQHQQPQEHHHQPNNSVAVEPMNPAPAQDFRAVLPADHQVIQEVFDKLVELCQAKAFNVPTKKKLDDVRRKLDGLYEKLGNGTLSQTTLNGLHQTVRAVQDFDYNMALNVVAEIAKVGSFTEISVFMPGVKVLLQTAVQLQVYIQ